MRHLLYLLFLLAADCKNAPQNKEIAENKEAPVINKTIEPAAVNDSLHLARGWVNDYADVLTDYEAKALSDKIDSFEKRTGNQLAVVIIGNLVNDSLENFATRLFNKWGIGQKEKNNGVLLLAVMENRKFRIEVGRGLEKILTSGLCGQVIDSCIKPNFKKAHYYKGFEEAVQAIISELDKPQAARLQKNKA